MSWVGWSVVALVGWGVWAILNKLALRSLEWSHLVLASWLVSTVAVLTLLARGLDPRLLVSRDGALAVAAAATSFVAVVSFYLAIRAGPVATVTPLSSLYPAVTAILAATVLREAPSATQWLGVGLALLAGILLSRP